MNQVVKVLGIVAIVAAIFFLVSCSNRSPLHHKQPVPKDLLQPAVVQPLPSVIPQPEVVIPAPQPVPDSTPPQQEEQPTPEPQKDDNQTPAEKIIKGVVKGATEAAPGIVEI